MVERVLPKHLVRVRFSLLAPKKIKFDAIFASNFLSTNRNNTKKMYIYL